MVDETKQMGLQFRIRQYNFFIFLNFGTTISTCYVYSNQQTVFFHLLLFLPPLTVVFQECSRGRGAFGRIQLANLIVIYNSSLATKSCAMGCVIKVQCPLFGHNSVFFCNCLQRQLCWFETKTAIFTVTIDAQS